MLEECLAELQRFGPKISVGSTRISEKVVELVESNIFLRGGHLPFRQPRVHHEKRRIRQHAESFIDTVRFRYGLVTLHLRPPLDRPVESLVLYCHEKKQCELPEYLVFTSQCAVLHTTRCIKDLERTAAAFLLPSGTLFGAYQTTLPRVTTAQGVYPAVNLEPQVTIAVWPTSCNGALYLDFDAVNKAQELRQHFDQQCFSPDPFFPKFLQLLAIGASAFNSLQLPVTDRNLPG